jgi:hypothetical protein
MRQPHFPSTPVNNVALIPAALLPYRKQWQALANSLPAGGILLCLPIARDATQQHAWDALRWSLQAHGRPTLVLTVEEFFLRL